MSANTTTTQHDRFFRGILVFAAFAAGTGVALGALSAHLPDKAFALPSGRGMLHSAVEIQMWHAIALCALALGKDRLARCWARWSCSMMAAGTLIFCVSVITLAFTNLTFGTVSVGRVAPYGGTLLILSWAATAMAAIKAPHRKSSD